MISLKQSFNLEGRTALITGGSRGLGLQIAEALGEMETAQEAADGLYARWAELTEKAG